MSVRQAEILALLALHPDGLTCEQLTLELYGEQGNPVSTRAQMSKLRRLLGPLLAARPYRLLGDVHSDFRHVERLLLDGDVAGALRAYRAPLLVESDAPRIVQARSELEGALRRAARAGGQDTLWTLAGLRERPRRPRRPARVHPRGAAGGPARPGRGRAHERAAGALGDNPAKGSAP